MKRITTMKASILVIFMILASAGLYISAPRLFMRDIDKGLSLGVEQKNIDSVNYYLLKGANPNTTYFKLQRYLNSMPVLSLAVKNEDLDAIKSLLKHGARVDELSWQKESALMFAVEKKNIIIISLLLQYKANPRIVDSHGKTALDRLSLDKESTNIRIKEMIQSSITSR